MEENNNIRLPDPVLRECLIDDLDNSDILEWNEDNNISDDLEFNEVIKISMIEYHEQLKKENLKKHYTELFKKLDIQIRYLLLNNTEELNFFYQCFEIEKNKFLNNDKKSICLFKSHYDYLLKFLDEIYTRPIQKNKKPKIDQELFELISKNIKYY